MVVLRVCFLGISKSFDIETFSFRWITGRLGSLSFDGVSISKLSVKGWQVVASRTIWAFA